MATGNVFDISASSPKGVITIQLTYEHDDWSPSTVKYSLRIDLNGAVSTSEFTATPDKSTLVTNFAIAIDPLLTCLLGCVGSIVTKVVIECFNKDISKYVSCLKSKGLEVAGEAIACAIECASKP